MAVNECSVFTSTQTFYECMSVFGHFFTDCLARMSTIRPRQRQTDRQTDRHNVQLISESSKFPCGARSEKTKTLPGNRNNVTGTEQNVNVLDCAINQSINQSISHHNHHRHHHHRVVARPSTRMAVSTTLHQVERSAARRYAVWRPKLSGLRSASTVRSQDWR